MKYHGNNLVSKQKAGRSRPGGSLPWTGELSDTMRGCAKMGDIAGLRAALERGDAAEAIDSTDDVSRSRFHHPSSPLDAPTHFTRH